MGCEAPGSVEGIRPEASSCLFPRCGGEKIGNAVSTITFGGGGGGGNSGIGRRVSLCRGWRAPLFFSRGYLTFTVIVYAAPIFLFWDWEVGNFQITPGPVHEGWGGGSPRYPEDDGWHVDRMYARNASSLLGAWSLSPCRDGTAEGGLAKGEEDGGGGKEGGGYRSHTTRGARRLRRHRAPSRMQKRGTGRARGPAFWRNFKQKSARNRRGVHTHKLG